MRSPIRRRNLGGRFEDDDDRENDDEEQRVHDDLVYKKDEVSKEELEGLESDALSACEKEAVKAAQYKTSSDGPAHNKHSVFLTCLTLHSQRTNTPILSISGLCRTPR